MHFVKQASLLLAALPEWPYLHCQWVTVGLNLSSFLYALVPHLTSDLEGPPELHSFKGSWCPDLVYSDLVDCRDLVD